MSSRVSALFTAAARGNLTAVRLVLEHGDAGGAPAVDARTADARGDTALHVAAAHMKWPVVSWLAANGADPDARNVAGHTALDAIPTAEGKDVYVAILARAPSPRANRVARRIAASPERFSFRGDDENAALDANVPAREATAKLSVMDEPFTAGPTAGRTNEPKPTGDRSRDDRGDTESANSASPASPRDAESRVYRPKDETSSGTFSLQETLRSDIAAVRDEIRALRAPLTRSSPDDEEDGVAREAPTRSSVSKNAFETPATTRRLIRRLDVHAGAKSDARADSDDDDDAIDEQREGQDDEGDVLAVVPKSLLRRAAEEVRRATSDLRSARSLERDVAERLASAETESDRWRKRAAMAESNATMLEEESACRTRESESLTRRRTAELETERDRLAALLRLATEEKKRDDETRDDLERRLDEAMRSLANERGARRDAQSSSSVTQMDAEEARAAEHAALRDRDAATRRAADAETRAAESSGRLEETRRALRDAEEVIRELRLDSKDARSAGERAASTAAKATAQCETLLERNEDVERKLKALESEYDETRDALATATEKLASVSESRAVSLKRAETAENRAESLLTDLRRAEAESSRRAEELAQARRDRECDADALAAERDALAAAREALAAAESKHATRLLETREAAASALAAAEENHETSVRALVEANARLTADVTRLETVVDASRSDEDRRRAATLARVAARMRNKTVSAAFSRWAEFAEETKRTRVAMARVAGKFSRRREAAAFAKWRHESREAREARLAAARTRTKRAEEAEKTERLLRRAAARIFGKTLQNAFERWRGLVRKTRLEKTTAQKAARKMTSLRVRAAFGSWIAFRDEEKERREIVARTCRRAARAHARLMLIRWRDVVSRRNDMRRRVRVVASRFKTSNTRAWFGHWASAVRESQTSRRVAERVTRRLTHTRTSRVFRLWNVAARHARRERLFVERAATRRAHRTKDGAFDAWHVVSMREKETRVATRRFAARRARLTSTRFLVSWRDVHRTRKKVRVAAARVATRVTKRSVASAFDAWRANASEVKQERIRSEKENEKEKDAVEKSRAADVEPLPLRGEANEKDPDGPAKSPRERRRKTLRDSARATATIPVSSRTRPPARRTSFLLPLRED